MKVAFTVSQATVRMAGGRWRLPSVEHIFRSLTGDSTTEQSTPASPSEKNALEKMAAPWRRRQRQCIAEIAFDFGTTQYCIVPHDACPHDVYERVFRKEWGLQTPKLLLSIMGGAGKMNLNDSKFDIEGFSKGLVEAALRTGAWVTTGGTKSGVMDIVGQAMKAHDKQRQVPCIGISPFGGLRAGWRRVLRSGSKFRPKVDAADVKQGEGEDGGAVLAEIQDNHTHSIICDDGNVGLSAFGSEVTFRAAFEKYVGSRETKVRGGARSSSQVPRVMILVNGGKISLKSVWEFIENSCPVVVCQGTGRAADLLATLVECTRQAECEELCLTTSFDEQLDLATAQHMGSETLTAEERAITQKIVSSRSVEVYTSNERLEDVVLRAVLGDPCDRTGFAVENQLMLAVQWGCTDYFGTLGARLVQDYGGEKEGPQKAIQVIFKELTGVWRVRPADQLAESQDSSGALVGWLLQNYLKHMDQFRVTEATLGKVNWNLLGGSKDCWKSLEGLLLWCIEQEASASVLETIWMYMEDPVHAALVAASACRWMGSSKHGNAQYSDELVKAGLDGVADRFERLAVLLLEELAKNGKGVEYLFQESDRFHNYDCFHLAHHLGCKKFVSAAFYRLAVDLYWRTPVPFNIKKQQLDVKFLNWWNLLRLMFNPRQLQFSMWDFLSIPYIKAWTHGISRLAFIGIYSYAVFNGLTHHRGLSFIKVMLFLWGLGFGVVEINQLKQKGSFLAYIFDFWNFLDALLITTLLVTLTLGLQLSDSCTSVSEVEHALEVIHALNLLPTWIRVLQVLQLSETLGTLLITIGGMCKDALQFLVLVSIFCLGFSCALTPILFQGEGRHKQGIIWAFWTIVGNVDEEALKKVSDHEGTLMGHLSHLLLYTLVLVSNVLLVNLLIAVMNSTYERNVAASQTEWAFYRVNAVLEFDEWADLPPPLNLCELFFKRSSKSENPRVLQRSRTDVPINKRVLKDSQQKAIVSVGLEEDAGEVGLLRTENGDLRRKNAELLRRNAELEGLAASYLLDFAGTLKPREGIREGISSLGMTVATANSEHAQRRTIGRQAAALQPTPEEGRWFQCCVSRSIS